MTGEVSLIAALLVAVGGGTGAWMRWQLERMIAARTSTEVLVALLVINTLGSLVLGVLLGLTDSWWAVALVGTGLCGGFTTFSTVAVDGLALVRRRRVMPALISVVGMAVLAVAAFAAGYWAVDW